MFKNQTAFFLSLCLVLTPVALFAQPDEQEHAARMRQANTELNALSSDLAKALGHPGFRGLIRAEIAKAKTREHIVKLDGVLGKASRGPNVPPGLQKLQDASRRTGGQFKVKATGGEVMEGLDLYFPVPEHRERWKGGIDFLVAFAPVHGRDAKFTEFIAYSVKTGKQVTLDPNSPPTIPVLVIAPEEHESHAVEENPAPIVKLPEREPDETRADAPKKPVHQEKGNSYVGVKYLNIFDAKEWWWEGHPEIYIQFVIGKGPECKLGYRWLSEVNYPGSTYDLWRRSSPAKWYFDDSYSDRMLLRVMERDGGYGKYELYRLSDGLHCNLYYKSDDDWMGVITMYRKNFNYNYEYVQRGTWFRAYWRKEH